MSELASGPPRMRRLMAPLSHLSNYCLPLLHNCTTPQLHNCTIVKLHNPKPLSCTTNRKALKHLFVSIKKTLMTKTTLLIDKFSLLFDRGVGGCEEKKMTVCRSIFFYPQCIVSIGQCCNFVYFDAMNFHKMCCSFTICLCVSISCICPVVNLSFWTRGGHACDAVHILLVHFPRWSSNNYTLCTMCPLQGDRDNATLR